MLLAADAAAPSPSIPPDLLGRAEAQGSVRVIVELRAGGADIPGAQDDLLRALAGTRYRVTRRFTAIPFLALEVPPEALRRLATLPGVVRVEEDRLHAPLP